MKRFIKSLFCALLCGLLLVGCVNETTHETPNIQEESVSSEKLVVTVDGIDYEVFVPEKTSFEDNGDGNITINTSSLSVGATVDLSGLSGCEYIINFDVVLNTNTEKLVLPALPNAQNYHILGAEVNYIDASAAEGSENIQIIIEAHDIDLGKGPENLYLQYELDISALAGAENIKSITVHGNVDLSKIADIGEVEKVYVFGENDSVSGLENLKSLKKLSFQSFSGDLSGIGNLSMKTLVFNGDIKQKTLDTLTKSETVTDLHINDEFLTNSDFMEKFPNLEYLVLSVETLPEGTASLDMITETQLDVLKTNLDKKPLEDFLKNGGGIYLVYDWSRTV